MSKSILIPVVTQPIGWIRKTPGVTLGRKSRSSKKHRQFCEFLASSRVAWRKMKRKTIDLHNYSLAEAEDYLIDEILEDKELGYDLLKIIHGYNHGVAIRNMIRKDFKKRYFNLFESFNIKIRIETLDEGRTQIHIL